eukprot:9402431-Pyramimonas_sp.AAC.1
MALLTDVMPRQLAALAAQLEVHPCHVAMAVGALAMAATFLAGLAVGRRSGGNRHGDNGEGFHLHFKPTNV